MTLAPEVRSVASTDTVQFGLPASELCTTISGSPAFGNCADEVDSSVPAAFSTRSGRMKGLAAVYGVVMVSEPGSRGHADRLRVDTRGTGRVGAAGAGRRGDRDGHRRRRGDRVGVARRREDGRDVVDADRQRDVVSLYSPGVASGTPAPRFVAPLKNATAPAGKVESAAVMLAVSTTGLNADCVVGLADSAVVVPVCGVHDEVAHRGGRTAERSAARGEHRGVGVVAHRGGRATTEAESGDDVLGRSRPGWRRRRT